MKPWKILSLKTVLQDRWIHVEAHHCQTSHGLDIEPYYVHKPKDWVVVIAFTQSGDIVIERQYRHGIEQFCYEFPAGNVEVGEAPLDCAQRELLEETGYHGGEWESLGSFAVNSANHSNFAHFFLATDVIAGEAQQVDEQEELEIMAWTREELVERIKNREFHNPHHLAGWSRYELRI